MATTLGRLHRGRGDAIVGWVRHLASERDLAVLERWVRGERPLVRTIRERAGERPDSISAQILLCQSSFDVEQLLLGQLLGHEDESVRLLALKALEELDSDRCHGKIVSAFFKDSSADLRARALAWLVRRDSFERRMEFLGHALRDRDDVVRIKAIRLMTTLPTEDACALLAPELASPRAEIRGAASDTLATMLPEDCDEALDFLLLGAEPTQEFLIGLIEVLDKSSATICNDLLDLLLGDHRVEVRAACVEPLVRRSGPAGWSVIERALSDRSARVRARAIQCLANGQKNGLADDVTRTRRVLVDAHRDPDPEVRSRVAAALAKLQLDGVAPILRTLQRDDDPRVGQIARRAAEMLETTRTA
jgi:HEAT repeat protein